MATSHQQPTVQDEDPTPSPAETHPTPTEPPTDSNEMAEGNNDYGNGANAGGDGDGASAGQQGPVPMSITVKSQDGSELQFKIKSTTKLGKVFTAHSARVGQDSLRYLFDGERIKEDSTPVEMEMQDGDIIEAFAEQIGGYEGAGRLY